MGNKHLITLAVILNFHSAVKIALQEPCANYTSREDNIILNGMRKSLDSFIHNNHVVVMSNLTAFASQTAFPSWSRENRGSIVKKEAFIH